LPIFTIAASPGRADPTMAAEEPPRRLLDLPPELHDLIYTRVTASVASLCALAAACRATAAAVSADMWRTAAEHALLYSYDEIGGRETVLAHRTAEAALRPFHTKAPSLSSPRKLRCPCQAPEVETFGGTFGVTPFSPQEVAWMSWFGRMEEGTLHLEHARGGRLVLHVHAHDSSECLACALLNAGSAAGPPSPNPSRDRRLGGLQWYGASQQRLLRVVTEFRHRVRIVKRMSVVDASTPSGKHALALLGKLPKCFCRRIEPPRIGAVDGSSHFSSILEADLAPAVVVVDVASSKLSVGRAMDIVGLLSRMMISHDRVAAREQADGRPVEPWLEGAGAGPGVPRLHRVVFAASSPSAASTLEKAVCSICFKSNLALGPGWMDDPGSFARGSSTTMKPETSESSGSVALSTVL
tara:strand:- start:54 stop:1289 length:1236 start_codon:yes stop_codon:yes gene_type:complete